MHFGPVFPPQINLPLTLMGDYLPVINGSKSPVNFNGSLICGGKPALIDNIIIMIMLIMVMFVFAVALVA